MSSIFDSFFNKGKEDREPSEVKYKNEAPENEDTIKVKLQIYGVVQGVGFRFTTKQVADNIGVNGIVRNENDGSVYSEATGSAEQIDEFINELAKGPSPSAQVDQVVVEYDNSITDYNGFGERY